MKRAELWLGVACFLFIFSSALGLEGIPSRTHPFAAQSASGTGDDYSYVSCGVFEECPSSAPVCCPKFCCEAGFACCGDGCCPGECCFGQWCTCGGACCDYGSDHVCCHGSEGTFCVETCPGMDANKCCFLNLGQTCCGDGCCDEGYSCCGGGCCPVSNARCLGDNICCYTTNVCGNICCNTGETCVNDACCPTPSACGDAFCEVGAETCIDRACCPNAQVCNNACCSLGDNCLPGVGCCPSTSICGSNCCSATQTCLNDQCCLNTNICKEKCCNEEYQCISGECCPNLMSCGEECCTSSVPICQSGKCLPPLTHRSWFITVISVCAAIVLRSE